MLLKHRVDQAYFLRLIETQLIPHDISHAAIIEVSSRKLTPRLVALQNRRKRSEALHAIRRFTSLFIRVALRNRIPICNSICHAATLQKLTAIMTAILLIFRLVALRHRCSNESHVRSAEELICSARIEKHLSRSILQGFFQSPLETKCANPRGVLRS